jgi:hypothetical protein
MLAERDQTTESALVRQLLEATLRMSAREGFPDIGEPETTSRDFRLSVRLAPDDRLLLSERSVARGMAAATYVSALVRSHLRNLPPLPKAELQTLNRLVGELTAIGRNLNQIAKALHQGGGTALPGRQEVAAMLKIAEGLRDHVKALLASNQASWVKGHAEKPH